MSIGPLSFQPIQVPSGPQYGVPYVLTGPDGERCVFNDDTDPDYVGMLTDISGFESPEVRESADELVEMDGGIHGDFWYGRRAITMEGMIMHDGDVMRRNMQIAKLQRATSAMRADARLVWTPDGGVQQYMDLRRNQPLRITGGWNKIFQVSMAASDPRIYSVDLHGGSVDAGVAEDQAAGFSFDMIFPLNFGAAIPSGQMFLNNAGNAESFPTYYVYGPGTSPAIVNYTTGKVISLLYTLGLLDVLIVDTKNRTVRLAQRSGIDDVTNYIATPAFTGGRGMWSVLTEASNLDVGSFVSTTGDPAPSGATQFLRVSVGTGTNGGSRIMSTEPGIFNSTSAVTGLSGDTEYAFEFNLRYTSGGPARTAEVVLNWVNVGGSTLRTDTVQIGSLVSGAWTQHRFTVTSPSAASKLSSVFVRVNHDGVDFATGNQFDFDKFSMNVGQTAVWGHGDMSDWVWASTPWNSASRKPGIEINMATAADRYGVVDFGNTQWGGLVPGTNDIRLSYFAFTEGAKLIADYRDAWM